MAKFVRLSPYKTIIETLGPKSNITKGLIAAVNQIKPVVTITPITIMTIKAKAPPQKTPFIFLHLF